MSYDINSPERNFKGKWRGAPFDLAGFPDDAFGRYQYVSECGTLAVAFRLESAPDQVIMRIESLNGQLPHTGLPAIEPDGTGFLLVPVAAITPKSAPAAMIAVMAWAEWVAKHLHRGAA